MSFLGVRHLAGAARRAAGITAKGRGLILLYHRVAQLETDPWDLCVSPRNFGEQLRVLKRLGNCLKARDMLPTITGGPRRAPLFSVTFDDGYADNATVAGPILVENGIPATFFIVSETVGSEKEFWWDALERAFLMPGELPQTLELTVAGRIHRWDLGDAAAYSADEFRSRSTWRAEDKEVPGRRQEVFLEVWQFLVALPSTQRDALVLDILDWAGLGSAARTNYAIMSREQLTLLADEELMEIGAHTRSHPSLPDISIESQFEEIVGGKADLERMLDRPVVSFSYPFGRFTKESEAAVEKARFTSACTTWGRTVSSESQRFNLPRVHVKDWDGATFRKIVMSYL